MRPRHIWIPLGLSVLLAAAAFADTAMPSAWYVSLAVLCVGLGVYAVRHREGR